MATRTFRIRSVPFSARPLLVAGGLFQERAYLPRVLRALPLLEKAAWLRSRVFRFIGGRRIEKTATAQA